MRRYSLEHSRMLLALGTLNNFLSFRSQWLESQKGTRLTKWNGKCHRMANRFRCEGLIRHDRILTRKRPL